MRNPLNKRIPRELRKNLGRYLSVFLILTATITIGSSFMAVLDSMSYTLNQDQLNSKVEDGQFEVNDELDETVIKELEEKGVSISFEPYVTVEEFNDDATLRIFAERKEMNLVSVFEGKMPLNDHEIAMDRLFAKNNSIKVGDIVLIKQDEYTVTGTLSFPDYNSLFKDNKAVLMDTQKFGPCIVSEDGMELLEGGKKTNLYTYRFNDRDLTDDEQEDILKNCMECIGMKGIRLTSILPADDNQAIMFLVTDMRKDGPMITVLIYILIAVLAFVFAVLISNTIEDEASIIGTLRASGYTKEEMIWHYLMPTVIVAIVASIVGNLLGYTVMIQPFLDIYYTTYCFSPYILRFSTSAFVLTTVVPVIIMTIINLITLTRKLSLSPLRFLRNDIKHGKQKKAIKLPKVSFFNQFRMRVMLQNKGSYLVLFIGIFLSSFLLMFGIGMMPLITHYVDTVDDSITYEYQYILKAPVECEEGEKLTVYELETKALMVEDPISITLYGISDDSTYFNTIPVSNTEIDNDSNTWSAVFADGVAKKIGAKVGDIIKFTDSYDDDKEYQIKIADIVTYQGSMVIFMPKEALNEMLDFEENYFNSYVSNEKLSIDEPYIAKQISRADMTGAAMQMVVSFKEVIVIMSAFAICIYLVLMYLLTKVVVEKNAIHIAFMKVFGYDGTEISKLYLRATTIVVMVSLVICIPLEAFLFKVTLVLVMSLVEGWIDFYLPWTTYAWIIGIGVVSYLVINSFHVRRVKRIPMSEALKQRE